MKHHAWLTFILAASLFIGMSASFSPVTAIAQDFEDEQDQPAPDQSNQDAPAAYPVQTPEVPGFNLPPGFNWPGEIDRPQHPPVAGLGDSREAPVGAPMRLAVRSGWQLASIRGGASDTFSSQCLLGLDTSASPECAFDRGLFDVTLRFRRTDAAASAAPEFVIAQVGQNSAEPMPPPVPLEPLLPPVPLEPLPPPVPLDVCSVLPRWSGWVLQANGDGQNIWVPVWTCLSGDGSYTILQDAPRGAEPTLVAARVSQPDTNVYELTVSGFCLNSSRSAPSEEHDYSLGVLSNDAGLNRFLNTIQGKRLASLEDRIVFQDLLWVYTEGGELTDADWAVIAALQ